MTFFLNPDEQQPVFAAEQPATNFIPTWMEGNTARKQAMDIEDNTSWRFQAHMNDVRSESVGQILETVDIQQIVQFAQEGNYPIAIPSADPSTITSQDQLAPWLGSMWEMVVSDFQSSRTDGEGADIPITPEQLEEAAIPRAQAEYEDAQAIIAMSPQSVTSDLVAGFRSGMGDARQAPFLLLGGGGGSIMRVMAREALINTATEGALLPSQFEMAERLGIEDPDVVATLRDAAIFGAVFGGGLEVSTRAFKAITGRGRMPEGLPSTPEIQALVDEVEDALATGSPMPDPARVEAALPATPPAGREPLIPPATHAVPAAPEAVAALPQVDAPMPEVDSATPVRMPNGSRPDSPRPRSITQFVIDSGGINRADQAGDLELLGINRVGFLRKAAVVDTPEGGTRAIRTKNGGSLLDDMRSSAAENGYLPQESTVSDLLNALREDNTGNRQYASADMDIADAWRQFDRTKAELDRANDAPPTTPIDDFTQKVEAEDGYFVDLTAMQMVFDPLELTNEVGAQFDRFLSDRWPGVRLSDKERREVVDQLTKTGGDAEYLVERFLERELDFAEMPKSEAQTYDDATPAADARQSGEGLEQQRQDGSADEGGEASEGRAFEQTDAGQQALIEGVDAVTTRDRLEAQQSAPMRGGEAAANDGLFDVTGRGQADMFSDPVATVDLHRRVGAQMRDEIAETGDFNLEMKAGLAGRDMKSASDILNYLDETESAVARIRLCGMMDT